MDYVCSVNVFVVVLRTLLEFVGDRNFVVANIFLATDQLNSQILVL